MLAHPRNYIALCLPNILRATIKLTLQRPDYVNSRVFRNLFNILVRANYVFGQLISIRCYMTEINALTMG